MTFTLKNKLKKIKNKFLTNKIDKYYTKKRLARPLKVAVVGAGKAGSYHLKVLENIGNVEISCIVNRGGSNLSLLKQKFGIEDSFDSLEKAISNSKFDAAILAVTPSSIFQAAKLLINNNISCLFEKPLGISLSEASVLNELAMSKNVKYAVGYNRRFYSSVIKAMEIIDSKGQPYSIHIDAQEDIAKNLKKNENLKSKDILIRNTSHAIDLFTYFLGQHKDVQSINNLKYYDGKQSDFMNFIRFMNGSTGSFISHWRSSGGWTVDIFGDNYKLSIDLIANQIFQYSGRRKVHIKSRSEYDEKFKAGVYLQNYDFLDCVLKNKKSLISASTDQAFKTMNLTNDIINSYGEE